MSNASPAESDTTRRVLPVLAALVLIGLLFLLPGRDAGTPATPQLLDLAPLELDEPPGWARQRGDDERQRSLDRLSWGGHAALEASRRSLGGSAGTLAPELLSRLRALGTSDPVLAEKLLTVLAGEDLAAPDVQDELVRRALGEHPLPMKAALRALVDAPGRRALDGILPRLEDPDPEVRSFARGALAQRASKGDVEAQAVVLDELEARPADPDLAYLAVVAGFPDPLAIAPLLRRIAAEGSSTARLIALTTLLGHGDAAAREVFEQLLASPDAETRIRAWQAFGAARVVAGEDLWRQTLGAASRPELLSMAQVLTVAIDTEHPAQGEAQDVLIAMAADRTNSVHDDVVAALYVRRHPWAVETTRQELKTLVGLQLGVAVDRVVDDGRCPPDYVDIVLARLADPALQDGDRLLLCRLLAHSAPAEAAAAVVAQAREMLARAPELTPDVVVLLPLLGAQGLELLAEHLDTPAGRALFIRVASDAGDPAALPALEGLLLDERTEPEARRAALDALARIRGGARAELLRRVLQQWEDAALKERARLIYWNYM